MLQCKGIGLGGISDSDYDGHGLKQGNISAGKLFVYKA